MNKIGAAEIWVHELKLDTKGFGGLWVVQKCTFLMQNFLNFLMKQVLRPADDWEKRSFYVEAKKCMLKISHIFFKKNTDFQRLAVK